MKLPNFCIVTIGICMIMLYGFQQYDKDVIAQNKVVISQKVNTIVKGNYTGDRLVDPKPIHTQEDYKFLNITLALSYMAYLMYLWKKVYILK